MKKFYLSGHVSLGNRGCEALVRATVAMLREEFGEIEVLVPSSNIRADSAQWPDAGEEGVRFVKAYSPSVARYWTHILRLPFPILRMAIWPFYISRQLKSELSSVDAVLGVGGDNYTLDYHIPALIVGIDSAAMRLGTPVVLSGCSVGPFESDPAFKRQIVKHLAKMSLISVREPESLAYV